jgi:hypothetical protein
MARAGQVMVFNLTELVTEFLLANISTLSSPGKGGSLWEDMQRRNQVSFVPLFIVHLIIITKNMLMPAKQNSFTHLRVLLILTDRGNMRCFALPKPPSHEPPRVFSCVPLTFAVRCSCSASYCSMGVSLIWPFIGHKKRIIPSYGPLLATSREYSPQGKRLDEFGSVVFALRNMFSESISN